MHALVTGGGRGLGRAIAVDLARRGATVVVAGRTESDLHETVDLITQLGGTGHAVRADVASVADVQRLGDWISSTLGHVDGLVNNAGVLRSSPILEMSEADFDAVFASNVKGVFVCTQVIGGLMRPSGGKIVNVGSTFGRRPIRNYAAYCASKAALVRLTEVAALELAEFRIQVNAVAPGYIDTDLNAADFADPQLRERVTRRIPARRIASPDDILGAIRFLLSSDSDYLTGATLVVDGGFGLT